MTRESLIRLVKIKMDEITPEGVSHPYDESIGPLLDESALEILEKGPMHLITATPIPLTDTANPPVSVVIYANDKAYIPVPSDYIRLNELKYPAWKKPVRVAITPENPQYKLQENEYLKAGYGRPVVVVVNTKPTSTATQQRYFECGKVLDPGTSSLAPSVANYVKKDTAENINDLFAEPLTWLCTSKVLIALGYADKAKIANDQYVATLSSLWA